MAPKFERYHPTSPYRCIIYIPSLLAVIHHVIYFPIVDVLYTIVTLDSARWLWRRG